MNSKFEIKKGYYTKKNIEGSFEFDFVTEMTLYEKSNLIVNIVNALVNSETNNYMSVQKDVLFKFYLIQVLTNIDVNYILDTASLDMTKAQAVEYQLDETEKLVNETTIYDILLANAGELIEELYRELNKALTYKTGIKEDLNNVILSVQKFLNILINHISENNFDELIQAATSIKGIAESPVTAEQIVKAFQNTEDYKGSQEIIDAKNKQIIDLKTKLANKDGTEQ